MGVGVAVDNMTDQDAVGRWRVAAASVRGVGHERVGLPCQDACRLRILPHEILVIAVADGAGSARLSQYGSTAAVEAVVDSFRSDAELMPLPATDDDWRRLLTNLLHHARAALEREAETRQAALDELATTLSVALVTPTVLAAAQIGDGAVVAADETGVPFTLTAPQSGEYLNETVFLTSTEAIASAQIRVFHGAVRRVAAITDGLQMLALAMPSGEAHAAFFASAFRFAAGITDSETAQQQLVTFLTSPRIRARADDDLTLVLAAYCKP